MTEREANLQRTQVANCRLDSFVALILSSALQETSKQQKKIVTYILFNNIFFWNGRSKSPDLPIGGGNGLVAKEAKEKAKVIEKK